jgi:hypothetical protein
MFTEVDTTDNVRDFPTSREGCPRGVPPFHPVWGMRTAGARLPSVP